MKRFTCDDFTISESKWGLRPAETGESFRPLKE